MKYKKYNFSSYAAIVLIIAGFLAILSACSSIADKKPITLIVLQNNDGEGKLTAKDGFGGAAAFVSRLKILREEAHAQGQDTITLSSGDNIVSSNTYTASKKDGIYYDARVLSAISYDVLGIGNHEFDFGPDTLAKFISSVDSSVPFVLSNADFSEEPSLSDLVNSKRLASSVIVKTKSGARIGVIGIIYPDLNTISSPRNVKIQKDLVSVVDREVKNLNAKKINKIILISHLQSLKNDIELVPKLRGIDVVITGGGEELLANPDDLLLPEDQDKDITHPYPLLLKDADGRDIPLVTTPGEYKYIGRLELKFDEKGNLSAPPQGSLIRVASIESGEADGVVGDKNVLETAVLPVKRYEDSLATSIVGKTEPRLDGTRDIIRTTETNFGDLIADALLWQSLQVYEDYGAPKPQVAIQNAGSVRNSVVINAGENISQLNTYSALPFSNFLVIMPDLSPSLFKLILENSVSQIEKVSGRFAQVSGFKVEFNLRNQALVLDGNTRNVKQEGKRVINLTLDDGTQIVKNGVIVDGAPSVVLTLPQYIANGGDQYPFDLPFISIGVEYREALDNYIQKGLSGKVSASQYPESGNQRIIFK